ncbi:ImcF-related family protein [uncultured Amaricoccus sp.]|uniref:ImcF-related family protein n=1 Tax=uncultured Amaricoccus sp. TaxID=339341 RepID=UPI002608EE78|nr:ImcF-related family protein [uncultured Amaricoccus sp.]
MSPDPGGPKTVVRPVSAGPGSGAGGDVFAALARPVIAFARDIERAPRPDAAALAAEARPLLGRFEQEGRRAGLAPEAILDARDALIALIDARARANPALPIRAWTSAFAAAVPLGPGTTPEELRRRAEAAARAGRARRDLARFLRHCLEAVEAARPAAPARRATGAWGWLLLAFALGIAGWAGWVEWRYRTGLLARLPDVEALVAASAEAPTARRAAALDTIASAVAGIETAAPDSPAGLLHRLPFADPGAAARREYERAADALLPGPLWEGLGAAIATEGDPDALYDTLRARAILEGRSPWQPRFLAGWAQEREAAIPVLSGLARHVPALTGPAAPTAPEDPELLAQARAFAAEGRPAGRAFLELRRSDAAAAVPDWRLPEAVPGLAPVLIRRSGRPLGEGIPGLYTAGGWAAARDGGAAAAIALASGEGARLLDAQSDAAPQAVLDALQARTLDEWSGFLADLRVRPFADQPGAVLISGALATRDSPLAALIAEVWRQTGGEDRGRTHAQQLRVAAEFGPAIQFVEQGRMTEVSRLFAGLNVALAALGEDADLGEQRLMSVQSQAASIATLRLAPTLVGQIIEDVLAQTAAANPSLGRRPEPLIWRSSIGPACAAAVTGRYPFAEGPDADPAELAGVFGRQGLVTAFFRDRLAPLMDTSESPWRWKPEARLSGFSPDSATFFERVAAVGPVYFGDGALATAPFTVEAIAERDRASLTLGGAEAAIDTAGAPGALAWPGPTPADGMGIAFAGGERAGSPGAWGMLRFLDGLRLRERDGGRRYLIDARLTEAAHVYFRVTFETPSNPVSARPLLRGLVCPPVL